ncbi:MAG: cysteine desulfurase NifS [Phycisphaerae bacterium]|nr:cysteine desulfurase NifS [Phycisphaerae bacterium]
MSDVIYMDNNATTRVADEVREAMAPYLAKAYGNPSSVHTFGGRIAHDVDRARQQVADLLGCDPTEVVFTSCGTESDNTAIRSALAVYPARRHVVTSRVEHPAVRNLALRLARGEGVLPRYRHTELPVNSDGTLDLPDVGNALDDDTAVCSIMWANNETGVVFPVERIGAMCRETGVLFHTDAVQAVGKIPMTLADLPIDMLSVSGHKLHAPKGIGALYVRRGCRFSPWLIGGHQEAERRGGTEAVAQIVALGAAAELAGRRIDEERTRVVALRDRLERELLARCPDARVNGTTASRLPNTTNISFEYIEGESILLMLDEYGICASSGSACTTGSLEPSHVLRAMGVPYTAAHGSVRFSLSVENTDADVDKVIEVLPPIIKRLRELSPFGREE